MSSQKIFHLLSYLHIVNTPKGDTHWHN